MACYGDSFTIYLLFLIMINRDIAVKLVIHLKRTGQLGSAGIARHRHVPRTHVHAQVAVARAVIR
jgi:hypothetical protein